MSTEPRGRKRGQRQRLERAVFRVRSCCSLHLQLGVSTGRCSRATVWRSLKLEWIAGTSHGANSYQQDFCASDHADTPVDWEKWLSDWATIQHGMLRGHLGDFSVAEGAEAIGNQGFAATGIRLVNWNCSTPPLRDTLSRSLMHAQLTSCV